MLYRALAFVTVITAAVAFVFQSIPATLAGIALAFLTATAQGMDL